MTETHTTPKDVFLHLLAIAMLYASVTSILTLFFQYINEAFPDILTEFGSYSSGANLELIRTAAAALIIVFPVYVLVMWLLQRDIRAIPAKADLSVRRWLVYLTLFLMALVIIIDLVTLMYHFLSGELTMRFLLKVFAVLVVAAAVFWYELWDLRKHPAKSRVPKRSAIIASVVIALTVVGGFFIIGSPFSQRLQRLDNRRITDLQNLQSQIVDFWINKDRLPSSVDELRNELQGYIPPTDPVTAETYEYRALTPLSFELCATFASAQDEKDLGRVAYSPMGEPAGELWTHAAGRACFERTIDPERYNEQRAYKREMMNPILP